MPNHISLDNLKRAKLLAYLTHGCSRRVAAHLVGCSPGTITNTVSRDPDFAAELARAEHSVELDAIKCIRDAAKESRQWRAAAWILERKNPDDFARRPKATYSADQVGQMFHQISLILSQDVPEQNCRRAMQKLDRLLLEFQQPFSSLSGSDKGDGESPSETPQDGDQSPEESFVPSPSGTSQGEGES